MYTVHTFTQCYPTCTRKSNQMLLCNNDIVEATVLLGAVLEILDVHRRDKGENKRLIGQA